MPTTRKGFGVPLSDGKRQIIKSKKPNLVPDSDSAETPIHGFGGNDSVPEAASVGSDDVTSDSADSSELKVLTIKQDELQPLIKQQAQQIAIEVNKDLTAQIQAMQKEQDKMAQKHRSELEEIQKELGTAKAEADRLKGIFKATGNSVPLGDGAVGASKYGYNVNTLILPSSQEPQGAAKDFFDIFNSGQYTPRQRVFDPQDGTEYDQLDTAYLDRFIRDNKQAIVKDMELLFKAHGFLRGSSRDSIPGSTLGTASSIQNAFLPFLSALMRMSHVPRYVWWQFVTTRLELGRVPGNNILVPRFQWLDEPADPSDYVLDTVQSSATISNDSQALSMLTTPIELFGYGLGRGNKVGTRPISIPEFITASSMVDLMNALQTRLGQNYNAFEDLIIRRIFQQTLNNPNNIYYNDAGQVTNTASNVGTGNDGTCTEEAMNSLFAEMTRREIPTFDNGARVGVLNTFAAAQFKSSLGDKLRANSEAEIQEVTSILNAGTLGDGITRPTGYLGTYCNFMLFESGTIAIGAAGTEGVNTVNLGAGAKTVRDSYFFGPGVVGKGVSLPMEIRQDDGDAFGTRMRFIWRSIEGWGSLDCTSTNPGQQDRCLVLRTTDQPV